MSQKRCAEKSFIPSRVSWISREQKKFNPRAGAAFTPTKPVSSAKSKIAVILHRRAAADSFTQEYDGALSDEIKIPKIKAPLLRRDLDEAIDFTMDVDKVEDPKGDHVIVTMKEKFLPYKKW